MILRIELRPVGYEHNPLELEVVPGKFGERMGNLFILIAISFHVTCVTDVNCLIASLMLNFAQSNKSNRISSTQIEFRLHMRSNSAG